jgi:hypothetical protein
VLTGSRGNEFGSRTDSLIPGVVHDRGNELDTVSGYRSSFNNSMI